MMNNYPHNYKMILLYVVCAAGILFYVYHQRQLGIDLKKSTSHRPLGKIRMVPMKKTRVTKYPDIEILRPLSPPSCEDDFDILENYLKRK